MEHSIGEVAKLTGITARTLRHYDQIGLLHPARVAANGYRWYGRPELRRLQRILLLRELGLPLPEVAAALDGDELVFLRDHRERLRAERARLDQVIETIGRTIADLEGRGQIADADFFVGLRRRTAALEADLAQRFGPGVHAHFDRAGQATAEWDRAQHEAAADQGRELLRRLADAMRSGTAPEEAHELMGEHHAAVCRFWPADASAYHALADVTATNPEQRAIIAEIDPQLPDWLAAAIRSYAVEKLGHQPGR